MRQNPSRLPEEGTPDGCATRYPLLMVHGAGFRDRRHWNYWGRIPRELQARGARVYYGWQDAWGRLEDNARVVAKAVDAALAETGADKVNVIAHSKGGLEARYLISCLGYADRVASLTTFCTPHHGSRTLDALLRVPPDWMIQGLGHVVNVWFRLWGDRDPDFAACIRAMTTDGMAAFNQACPDQPQVYGRSYATAMASAWSDHIMALPYALIRRFDGENDGMVGAWSAAWGDFQGVLRGKTRRGISHPDAVDLRRHANPSFDMIPIYVSLVRTLKEMGY